MTIQERIAAAKAALEEQEAARKSTSPRPWARTRKQVHRVGADKHSCGAMGSTGGVCNCLGGGYMSSRRAPVNVQAEANAEFIVRACNIYDTTLRVAAHLLRCTEDNVRAGRWTDLELVSAERLLGIGEG
jgi:hypothetical protein